MLGWSTRYEKILKRNPDLHNKSASILELGCGPHGLARFTENKIIGLEATKTTPREPNLSIIEGTLKDIRIESKSFDYVVCVDVLEHIPEADRAWTIREICRIARKRVIISCPIKDFAAPLEKWLASWYSEKSRNIPWWLREHLSNGLPSLQETIAAISETGHQFNITPNEGALQHYASIFLDELFPFTSSLTQHTMHRAPSDSAIKGSEWDIHYSYIFEINTKKELLVIPLTIKTLVNNKTKEVEDGEPAKDLHLYSFFHNEYYTGSNPRITNIKCGANNTKESLRHKDDKPTNTPRLDNSRWSELSGIYKIWADTSASDIIGLAHYRRFLLPQLAGTHHIRTGSIKEFNKLIDSININEVIENCQSKGYIYIPKALDLRETIHKQYARLCNEYDLLLALEITTKMHPDYQDEVAGIFKETSLHPWNILIATKEDFRELFTFVFSILKEFEKRRPCKHENNYQARDISFLAERLCHIWFQHTKRFEGKRLIECPIIFFDNNKQVEDIN